jgi:hypothetical protein
MFSISQTISQRSGLFFLTTFSLPLLQRRRHHLSERTKRQTSQHGRGLRRLEEFAVPGSYRLRHSIPHFIPGLCQISYGISDLDASIHNYVVFGNADDYHDTPVYNTFRPQDHGVQPLSLTAVVCDDQLVSCLETRKISAHTLPGVPARILTPHRVLWHMGRRERQRWPSFGW